MRRIAVAAAAIVVAAGCWDALRARPRELRVTFLDVGQGDGCVLESPGGKVLVVDAGGLLREGQDDEGRRVVAPYLRYRGINGIDAIVLTHPHADHIGGATTLIDRFPTRDLLDDGVDERAPLVTATLGEAAKTGARARICRRGETLDFGDGVTAEALGPPEDLAGAGANNASVVLMVRYGRTSFLLTGDAEAPEEEEIVAQGRDLSCDVLKVGHHGSRTSSTAMLLAAAHPRVAVISVGKRNIYNHPSPGVVDRLQQAGATVYRTDLNGAVICRSDGARVTVETMVR